MISYLWEQSTYQISASYLALKCSNFFLDKRNITYKQMHKAIYWGSMLRKNHLGFWCYTVLWNWGSWGQLYTTHYVLWNWTFTGVICDQNDPNNNKWRQNELKNSPRGPTLRYWRRHILAWIHGHQIEGTSSGCIVPSSSLV